MTKPEENPIRSFRSRFGAHHDTRPSTPSPVRFRGLAAVGATLALVLGSFAAAAPANAYPQYYAKMCNGFSHCSAKGMSTSGYSKVYRKEHWGMYGGHNCTNYVAYRLEKKRVKKFRAGSATQWGNNAKRAGLTVTRSVPRKGDVAWWSFGHVAYVESVNAKAGTFIVSEDNWGGNFAWRKFKISQVSGFIVTDIRNTKAPRVSGVTEVGHTLRASAGSWSPAKVAVHYQWLRSGKAITGAKASTYKLTKSDAGKRISVKVTGTRKAYLAVAKVSGSTSYVVNDGGK